MLQADKRKGVLNQQEEVQGPLWSPEYQRLYADFLSEGLIFGYQLPHHEIYIGRPFIIPVYLLCLFYAWEKRRRFFTE